MSTSTRRAYSPFIETLYDQSEPVGHIGRGTHYSVLRAPVWHDIQLQIQPTLSVIDFAVIWDEDHDRRLIEVVHGMFFGGLLAPVRFLGERKGGLSVILAPGALDLPASQRRVYSQRISDLTNVSDDSWTFDLTLHDEPTGIISDSNDRVRGYLQNIDALWSLGIKPALAVPARSTVEPIDEGDLT